MAWTNQQAAHGARILRTSLDAIWLNSILPHCEVHDEYDHIVATGQISISLHEFVNVAPRCLITRHNLGETRWAEHAQTYSGGDLSAYLITMSRQRVEYCIIYRDIGEQVVFANIRFQRTKFGGIRLIGADALPISRSVIIYMLAPPDVSGYIQ